MIGDIRYVRKGGRVHQVRIVEYVNTTHFRRASMPDGRQGMVRQWVKVERTDGKTLVNPLCKPESLLLEPPES